MKDAGCDESHIRRVNTKDDDGIPGAIWFIYRPEDADEIREFLEKIKKSSGNQTATKSNPQSKILPRQRFT